MANVRVALRVRPLSKREDAEGARIILNVDENVVRIRNVKDGCGDTKERLMEFGFDYCYWSVDVADPKYASQEVVYQDLGTSVLSEAIKGYNVCLFAYGQTGSGKTYTMMGTPTSVGLTPRICEGLFSCDDGSPGSPSSCRIEVSFLEIYNERVRDLLNQSVQKKPYTLRVREHPEKGPYVQGLSQHVVTNYEQVVALLEEGMGNRITAATHIHEASSRSHAIFTIQYTQAMLEDNLPTEIASKINLVDLAGSERASPNYCKDRLTEGSNINRSLVTLGIVISALAQNSQMTSSCQSINSITSDWDSGILGSPIGGGTSGSKRQPYIPYRDSILTWLLKDSLGGNSKTVMITTVSPASSSYNETMSTLRYASNAKNIINKPRVNEDANVKLIRELREEINRLKLVLRSFEMRTSSPSLSDEKEGNLAELVRQNELKIEQLTKDWTDKWTDKKAIMEQCKVDINRGKAGVTIDFSLPHLIAMEDDILSTGVVIYHLREGTTKIGRNDSEHDHDIVLLGEWMEKEHCVISNNSGVVELCPVPGAPCTVNGLEVTEACRLSQGAVIVLGKTHRFRFNHPAEAAILRQRRSDSHASFISSGSLDWLDLSGDFSEANQLNFNERGTESLNEENQQKLENLKAFYQQQVEEQQRYVQELKKQIEASQIKGEKELEHEQSVINQLMKENEQCLAKEEHRWTAVHQHRRESAAQTEPKTYAEVQNSVQTEDINPSPAEQDRKRLVQLELLQKCSLRKAERNIRRNKVKFHLERIAKKQNLLQAKKNLQQLQAVCWISEDIVKQTCPRVSNAHKSTEKSTTLRRSRSSPSGFAYCRRWTLPYFMPPRPPVSGLLKRKGRYETITSSEFKPRRSFSEECLLKASCNCSKNGNLEYKETSVARTKAQFAEKRTFGSVTNLNKTGICCSTTVLISDPQMTKKRPKMDKAGNRSKGVPNTRPVESPKKRSARVPVSTAIRDPKPKSFKSPSQQAVGGFKKRAVLERSKILQKNEGTKSVEKFTKHAKNPSTVVRVPTEHPSLAVKAVKQELDSSLAIAQKKSGNEVAKISSSADNINQLSSSFPIDTRCKSTERTNSRVLKPATGLLENWREGDESASSDSESFYSIDSLSSAYASALNEQLKIEEQEVNKTQSDQKNSDSEDSQISQDSLMERENRKERLNKRKFFKCKTILNPCSSSQPLAVAQNTEPIVLAGSITSGLSKCFSLDSLADADELSETDSAKELPAEIFWKLQSPRFPMPHSQNQRDVDTTQESKKSTMEINGSFYLNVNQGVSSNYCDPPLVKSFDVYNRTPANVYDVKEVQSDSNMPPLSDICSACKSEDQSPTFEMVVNDVGGDSNHLVPSLHSCPKPFVQVINEDSNQLLLQPLFSQCSKSLPPLHETVSLAIKDDHGSMELVENHNHDLENLDENIEPQTTQNCISIITNNAVNCDFKEVQNQSTKKLSSIILDGHLSNNQAEPASIEQKSLKNSNGVASDFINKADKKRHTSIGIEQLEMIVEGQPTCGEHTDFSIVKENKKELIETLISKPCEEILPKTSTFNTKIINYHKDLNQNVCHVLSCSESSDITPLDKKENGERFPVAQTQGNYEKSYCSDNTSGRAIDQNIKHVANINNQKQFEMTAQCTVTSSQMQDCQSVKKHLFGIQKLTNNETGTTENRNADDCSVADMLVTSTLLHQPVMSDIELRENSYNLPKSLCRSRTESDADSGGSQDFINLNSDSLVRIQKQSEHGTRPNNDICLVVDTGADMCNNLSSTKEDTATVELTDLNNPVASHSPTNASFLHALGSGSFDNCAFSTLDVSLAEQTVEVMETPLKGDEPYSLIPNTSHTTIVEDTCSITVPADNDIGSVLPTASLDETNTELDSVCANLESCHVEHDVEETTFLVSNALFSHKSKLDVVLPPPYSTDQDTVQTQQKYLGVDAEESDDGAGTINDTQGMNKVIYRKANLLQDNCREIVLFTSHEHAVETSLIQTSGHHHEGIPTTLNHSESQPLSEQNHISRPKCICVSDTDENKNEISQFSNQRSDDATLGFSTYDNHNPNDLNVDILEYGYKTGNSPQTTTDSGVLCGQAHMPKSRNSGNHFLILTPMSQDEEMVPSENSTSSHGNFKMSEYMTKHFGDCFTNLECNKPTEHTGTLYMGIDVDSSSSQEDNRCYDMQTTDNLRSAGLVLPYYDVIMQHELFCESENCKDQTSNSSPCITHVSSPRNITGNDSGTDTLALCSSQLQENCTSAGQVTENMTHSSASKCVTIKETRLALEPHGMGYEPNILCQAKNKSGDFETSAGSVIAVEMNPSIPQLHTIYLHEERRLNNYETHENPQNESRGKIKYFQSESVQGTSLPNVECDKLKKYVLCGNSDNSSKCQSSINQPENLNVSQKMKEPLHERHSAFDGKNNSREYTELKESEKTEVEYIQETMHLQPKSAWQYAREGTYLLSDYTKDDHSSTAILNKIESLNRRLKEPSLEVVDKPKQINVSNDNSVIQTDACSEHCSDPAFLNNVAAGKIHTQSPICSDFNDSQSVEMDNIQDHDRRCQKIINEGGAETKHYSGHSCSTACCSSNKQPHECSLNPALTTPTIAIKCDHGHPSVIPAHSFQTLLMECTRLNGAEADISSPRLNENKGVSTEPTHLGEPRAVKPHNYVPSIIAYQTTVIPQCIPTQQENVDDKIYVASKEQPKKKCNVIQELQHETDILRETSADNKEMLNFSSSDINPFVHPWQSEKCGNVRWRQYAFNSASDLSCTRYPARQGDDRILRCSSVDEGLNANNSPFQCHLSSYANARLMSSTLSSIDDPQTAEEPTRMLEDHQYYYNYLLSADSIELSKKNDGSSDGLNPKSENSSGLVDEIMLLYTSESETYNENDARIHCEKETQTKERHRRQNRHQRSYTDVSHIKLSKTRNEYPRRASLSSMQNMSLHLSQLLHETSELLGNLSQHQADFHADPRGSAVDICQRTLRDSSTQTTVDIGIQTDLERTKKGREGNRLLNTSEINIYVKVIGSDSLTQPTENITSSVKLDNHVVPKTQSLPNLHDFASCEKPQGRLFQSAHVRASTPFLNSLKDMSSQTSFSPSARSCGAPAMLHIKKEPIPEISSSSASSAIQAPVYQPRKKPNLNKQNQKLICQGDTIMVDRASSPILTLSASKKPLNKIVPQHDFTSQNILKFFRHQRKKHHSTSEPQINNSSQTETDSECGSFEGSVGAVNKSEHRQSTCRRISEGKKPVHRFGSEACLIKEAYPLDCNRSRSISEVSGIGRLSNDMKCFSLRRRDKADGTSATALNSHHHNVHSPSWEKEILSRNLVKENTSQMPGIPDKKLCNDTDNQNSFTPSFNDSFFKNVSHPISVSEVGGIDLHKDVESVVESECNTEVLLNQDSSSRVSQKTYNYTLQELPMHNKFRNWPGVQYSPTRTGSLIRSSAEYSVTASPTKTETSEACENRTKEIERLQKERAEIMSGIHLELNQQPLTVQLAEAKLSYGIGETDALLRVIQNGKLDGQDTISIKEQLYDRHMKVIESLRKEREERLQSFRRSRSLSPQKQLSTSQASLASLRESDLPSRRREYLQQLRKEVVDNTRIQKSKKPVQCPSEIEMMLRDYQKAREEAKTEIARARDKLRERAEQEKKRIQQSGKPKDDLKLKTLLSTSTLLSNSSISLSSGPTSGYNSSIPANYDKHGQLGDRETSPRSMDHPTVSTRGRSSLRNSHHLPDFENASKSKTADADLIATGKTCPGYIPYTSSPPSSIVSYQEFARLVQVNATSEVMAACSSNLMNLFNYQAASGWRYQCMDRDVLVYYKAFLSATKHGFLGVGIIKRPLHDVWCMVKDIGTRRLYDQSILSAQVHQRASSGIQLVHVVNNMSLCYLKQPRDFCCIAVESKEDNTYSLCFQSLYDESMPRPSNDTVRGEILPSAWVLQADCINGETVTRVIYMVQVDLGAPTIPSRLLSVAAKRQPLVIASLAKFLSK